MSQDAAEEVKEVVETKEVEEVKPVDATIGEVLTEKEEPKEPETVGLDKFLHLKKQNKELQKTVRELQERRADGEDSEEISDEIKALAKEYEVNETFLTKLVAATNQRTKKELADELEKKLGPITARDRQQQIDSVFQEHFKAAMEQLPELNGMVNAEAIKILSLDPRNAKKTFVQLIEETYGGAVTGKRTIESPKPGGGKEPEEVDVERAKSDSDYFKQVMANPRLKAQYNKGLTERLSRTF